MLARSIGEEGQRRDFELVLGSFKLGSFKLAAMYQLNRDS